MAEVNRKHRAPEPDRRKTAAPYASSGHPSIPQLMAEQGTGPILDPASLRGDFWPAEESIEDFLDTLHQWRGHKSDGIIR